MENKRKIDKLDLFLLAVRSLFVQASWNFNKMQGLGFLYMIEGSLKKIYGNSGAYRDVVRKYADFFNTNPYFAPAIGAAVVKYEEEIFLQGYSKENPESVKASLMGPFGAIGDSLFWTTIRPLVSVFALIAAVADSSLAPLIFLFLYSAASLSFRYYAAFMGYKYGKDIIFKFRELNLYTLINRLKNVTAFFLGIFIVLLSVNYNFKLVDAGIAINLLIALAVANVSFFLFTKRITTVAVILMVLACCIVCQYTLPF